MAGAVRFSSPRSATCGSSSWLGEEELATPNPSGSALLLVCVVVG